MSRCLHVMDDKVTILGRTYCQLAQKARWQSGEGQKTRSSLSVLEEVSSHVAWLDWFTSSVMVLLANSGTSHSTTAARSAVHCRRPLSPVLELKNSFSFMRI